MKGAGCRVRGVERTQSAGYRAWKRCRVQGVVCEGAGVHYPQPEMGPRLGDGISCWLHGWEMGVWVGGAGAGASVK